MAELESEAGRDRKRYLLNLSKDVADRLDATATADNCEPDAVVEHLLMGRMVVAGDALTVPCPGSVARAQAWRRAFARATVPELAASADLRAAIRVVAEELRSGELSHTDVANWLLDLDGRLCG